jgi:hypothetical protein
LLEAEPDTRDKAPDNPAPAPLAVPVANVNAPVAPDVVVPVLNTIVPPVAELPAPV